MDRALYVAAINRRQNTTTTFEDFTAADSKISLRQVTCGQGNTSLHVATIGGNETFVEKTLQSYPLLVYEANMKGQTALHIAARLGHLEVASLLISYARRTDGVAGAGTENLLTMVDHEKNTALHEAVRFGHYDIVELLIKKEPSLTCLTNDCGESPLFIAVDRKFYDIAWRILETFPNCSCSGRNGMTVMHAAVIRLDFISLGYFRFPVNRKLIM
ncbi:Transmembrane protein [Parasponia andersonii]|uniref:Transmembrane protein n=1 Tax=Parasponia andersonii TaxID=3476 RepID=A0A2P5AR92_PARAD|nr:Transmembrane protein [Parasponia andersonii]